MTQILKSRELTLARIRDIWGKKREEQETCKEHKGKMHAVQGEKIDSQPKYRH